MLSILYEHAAQVLKSHAACHAAVQQAFSNLKILDADTGNKPFRQFVLAGLANQPLWMEGIAAQKALLALQEGPDAVVN